MTNEEMYRIYVNANNKLKATKAKKIWHIDKVDFDKDTCFLITNDDYLHTLISTLFFCTMRGEICVSNPSALHGYKFILRECNK